MGDWQPYVQAEVPDDDYIGPMALLAKSLGLHRPPPRLGRSRRGALMPIRRAAIDLKPIASRRRY